MYMFYLLTFQVLISGCFCGKVSFKISESRSYTQNTNNLIWADLCWFVKMFVEMLNSPALFGEY